MNRGLYICVCGKLWQAEALLVVTLGVFEENVRRGSLPKTAGTAARNTGTIVRMNSLVDFLLLLFVVARPEWFPPADRTCEAHDVAEAATESDLA